VGGGSGGTRDKGKKRVSDVSEEGSGSVKRAREGVAKGKISGGYDSKLDSVSDTLGCSLVGGMAPASRAVVRRARSRLSTREQRLTRPSSHWKSSRR
jgi:hypothetical protein